MYVDYSKDQKVYSQEIETDTCKVCEEVNCILDMLETNYSLDTDQCFDIKVILCELLQNAIKHGNDCDISKKIRVDIWFKEKGRVLGIRVKDQGCGFDSPKYMNVALTPPPECDPMEMDESGRGLYIVNELCDCIEFNTIGNTVTVIKRL